MSAFTSAVGGEETNPSHAGRVVLVTGGNGFLGGHIVNGLLRERTALLESLHIKEVRIFDKSPVTPNHADVSLGPVRVVQGDITDAASVLSACAGVDVVVHCVAVGSEDWLTGAMTDKVNVGGTKTLLDALRESRGTHGRSRVLLYVGSVTAAMGEEVNDGTNESQALPDPAHVVSGDYGRTKNLADRLVRSYNGRRTADGAVLHTCVLRLPPLYGEGDSNSVSGAIETAKRFCGYLTPVGAPSIRTQFAYAGNVAHGFVCALLALERQPKELGGKAYYICDDTRPQPFAHFIAPFLKGCGCRMATVALPWPFAYFCACVVEASIRLVSLGMDTSQMTLSLTRRNLQMIKCSRVFSDARARLELQYLPPYTPEESFKRSLRYYQQKFA